MKFPISFLLYFLILAPYFIIAFKFNKVLQFNLINIFLFAHFLLFIVTPILFSQTYMLQNIPFIAISLLSLSAILFAFSIKVPSIGDYYFIPKLKLFKYIFYFAVIMMLIDIAQNINDFSIDKTANSLSHTYAGKGVLSITKQVSKYFVLIYFGYLFNNNKIKFTIFYFLYFISVLLTSSHRTPVAITFASPFILYFIHFKNGKFKIHHLIIAAVLIANIMFFMNYFRQGLINKINYSNHSFLSANIFLNTLAGVNTTKNLYTLIEKDYPKEYFEKVYYLILGFVPRRLFPNKPVVSFNIRTTEKLFGYKVGDFKGADVITYTVPGEGYIQFSYLGVCLFTFFAVILCRISVTFFLKFKYSDFIIISTVFSVFINFRSAFDSFYYSSIYGIVYLALLIPFTTIMKGRFSSKIAIIK